ncbi:MAG: ABC transporter ATP-binding protein SaoA [Pseudomonadota bacterium]
MLEVCSVKKSFAQKKECKTVLDGVSFTVEKEEFVTLLGPSGCGKTTLLTIMAGFQEASDGEVRVNGRVVQGPGPDRGFVFQDYALFPWMTVSDNVLFPMKERGMARGDQKKRLDQLLHMAHLEDKGNLYPSQISGGMKQRTAFIRALAGNPEALFLDEPLGAVDHQMRQQLQDELYELWMAEKKTVVMVTHDVDEAVYLSDRVIVLSAKTGQVQEDVHIDLPRPRNRGEQGYMNCMSTVYKVLKDASVQ